MAKVGPQRAAELTGRSKSTVQRAMKGGKLSYEIDNAGRRVIDVSELERVFGLAPQGLERSVPVVSVESELEKAANMIEAERMKMRIRMLEDQLDVAQEQLDDLKEQRDQWQKQAQQVLITSQYSQKQAEELKEELKERDRRAQVRRQMEIQRRGSAPVGNGTATKPSAVKAAPESEKTAAKGRKGSPFERQRQVAAQAAQAAKSLDIQGLWQKIRGESVANSGESAKDKASA